MRRLGVFAAVVELQSFTKAAARLGVGKAAVSKQIKLLEEELGARLLNRSTRSLTVTDVGAQIYDCAVKMLDAAQEARSVAQTETAEPRGQLCVASTTEFGRTICIEALGALRIRYPELHIRLLLSDRAIDLVGERVDVGIRLGFFKDSSLVQRRIATAQYGLYASPDYIARQGAPTSPAEAALHTWVLHSGTPSAGSWVFRRGDDSWPVEIPPDVVTDDTAGLTAAVTGGLGMTAGLDLQMAVAVSQGTLVRLLPDYTLDPLINIYAVMSDRRFRPRRVSVFLECLDDAIAARRALLTRGATPSDR